MLQAEPLAEVYPSGGIVPENLLRIEVRFSMPVEPALRVENLTLHTGNGVEIKNPFLDLLLPGRDGRRVTILLHPARVKSGVGANLAFGRALHAGETVTLIIEHPMLSTPVRKTWRVTAFDARPPRPERWTFEPPQPGSRSPLVVTFDKPVSSAAEDLIAVRGVDGLRLAGDAHLENGETTWRFVPTHPWATGSYAIVVHPDLEDVAGNRLDVPFESRGASRVSGTGDILPFQLPSH